MATASRPALAFLLAALFVAKLGVSLWAVDRGFDVGDEGYYLLNLNHPEASPPLFEFYKLLSLIDPPIHFEIVPSRLLRIVTELLATWVLALGVYGWARERFPRIREAGFAPFLAFVLLGSLLSVGTRAFGYNDVTNLLSYSATACLFALLRTPRSGGRARAPGLALASGLLIGLQLFVKFPPALLLSGITLLLLLAILPAPARRRLGLAATHLGGAALGVLLFVLANGGLAPLAEKLAYAGELNRVSGYGVTRILWIYVHHDIGSHVNLAASGLALALALGLGLRLLPRDDARLDRALAAALVTAALVLAVGSSVYHAFNVHPSLVGLFCLLVLLSALSGGLAWAGTDPRVAEEEEGRFPRFAPLALLMALPFIEIVGTNVALTLRLPSHAAPLFCLLGVLMAQLRDRGLRRFTAVAVALLAALTTVVFVQHQVRSPYGLANALPLQVHSTPRLPGMKVDLATRVFLEELSARMDAAGFRRGDPVVALDFMPGLVHYLDGRSPGFPFYLFDRPAFNCWAVNRTAGEPPPFLILGQDMSVAQASCIEAFDFPGDFRSLGTLRNPWERAIPQFFGGPPMPYVQIFAPRDVSALRR